MLEFHDQTPQATVSEELAQGPYVAARAGFELTTIQTKGAESTNEPPSPCTLYYINLSMTAEVLGSSVNHCCRTDADHSFRIRC